jgi:hypothetical protein
MPVIPATRKLETRRFKARLSKVCTTYFKNKTGVVVHIYNPSYKGDEGRRIMVPGHPGKSEHDTLPEKQTKSKKNRDMTQVVEHLPINQETTEFNLQSHKNNKNFKNQHFVGILKCLGTTL